MSLQQRLQVNESRLVGTARGISNLSGFTQEQPWLAVALAAGTGFLVGTRWLRPPALRTLLYVANVGLALRQRRY